MKKLVIAGLLALASTAHAHDLTDKQAEALIKWAQNKEIAIYKKACDRGSAEDCRLLWQATMLYQFMQKDFDKQKKGGEPDPEPATRVEPRSEPRDR